MSVEDWRRKIDEIDRQLVELLNERSHCERQVLEAVEAANRGPLSAAAIRRLFERILDEARSVERHVMGDSDKADGGSH
jgi:chorismate mutase